MPSLVELCQKHFDTNNLYDILSATADSTDKEIRRAYHRQSLKYHPDRVPEADKKEATVKFQILGKAYLILSDSDKKAAYDENGEINDEEKESVEDWMKYWREHFPKVDLDDIKEFEKNYKGSEEETEQLKSVYEEYEGDMDRIMEHVLCCTIEDEPRFEKILKELIDAGSITSFPNFVKETRTKKANRKKRFEKEKKEAEKAAKEMGLDGSEDALKAAIGKNSERQGEEWSNLTSNLEKKYAKPAEKAGKRKAAAKTTTGPKRTRVTRKRGGDVEKEESGDENDVEVDSEPGTSHQDEKNKKEKPKATKKGAHDDSGDDEDSGDKNANGMEEKSDNEDDSEAQKTEKKGRGRPKAPPKRGKKVEKEGESQAGDDSEPEVDSKNAENDESEPDVAEKTGRKGRGRPKATKKTKKDANKEDSDKETEKPKTRGRAAAKAPNDVPEVAKKPARGKPKPMKTDSDDEVDEPKKEEMEDDENSGSDDSLPAAKPARGGKGAKAKAAPKEKKEPAARGRGRKKAEEKDEEEVEEKAPAKKGRGKDKVDVGSDKVEMKSAKIVMKRVVTRNTRGALNGDDEDEEEEENNEEDEPKSKIKKTTAASKRGPGKKATEEEEKVSEEEDEDDEMPKKRNARKPAATKAEPKKRGPAPKGKGAAGVTADKKSKAVKK